MEREKEYLTTSGVIYLGIALYALVTGKFFLKAGDEMGYVLLYIYLLLPLASAFVSAVWVCYRAWKGILVALLSGYISMLVPAIVFSYPHPWISTEADDYIFGVVPVIVGVMVGLVLFVVRKVIANFKLKRG